MIPPILVFPWSWIIMALAPPVLVALWFLASPLRLQLYLAFLVTVWVLANVNFLWDYVSHPAPEALATARNAGLTALAVWLSYGYIQYRGLAQPDPDSGFPPLLARYAIRLGTDVFYQGRTWAGSIAIFSLPVRVP